MTDNKTITEQALPVLRALRDRKCKNKEELRKWLKTFFKVDLPDQVIYPESNCSPMDMVWMIYNNMVGGGPLPEQERFTKALFYACRTGFKTLGAAIVEILALIHDGRGVCHIAAGESHVKHCYNDYVQPYIRAHPLIWELIENSIMEKTITKTRVILEAMPCTKKRVQGPHQPLVCKDEIDVVQDVGAYMDIDGIPINMPDGRPPITFGISVRKSAFGLVQKEIDEAPQKGVKVFHWNIIDIMEKCPEARSGTQWVSIYVKRDSLVALSELQYDQLFPDEKKRYEKCEGFEGCLKNCKIFAACKTHSKRQASKSRWLKSCDYVQMKLFESGDEQMAIAQFLCLKPPTTGLVYSDWRDYKNVVTYNRMYEIFTGEVPDHDVTDEEMVKTFEKHEVYPIVGIDFGYTDPTVAYLIYIDGQKRVFIVKEIALLKPEMTDEEFAHYFSGLWGRYKIDTIYGDVSNPSAIRALRNREFHCAGQKRLVGGQTPNVKQGIIENVIKDVRPGISTVRSLIRIPGTEETRLFVHESCSYLILSMQKYHHKLDSSGTPVDGEYDHGYSHSPDAIRYALHSRLGLSNIEYDISPDFAKLFSPQTLTAPAPGEIGRMTGQDIRDNSADYPELTEKDAEKKGDETQETGDDDGGFSFSF